MPRVDGVYSPPAGTKGAPNTVIQSSKYNALVDDVAADANAARPITAGGTGATNATAARTALGLAIGTNVQAYDAGLQSIAGLTTAANQMIYTTAADAYATTALTPFARTILDDADAATARATLGANSAANLTTGTLPNARLVGDYSFANLDLSGGLTLAGGSGINFNNDDTLTYDDSTNTYSLTADGSVASSWLAVGRLRLTNTASSSETTTNHVFQIGPDTASNLRFDTAKILAVNNGVGQALSIPYGVSFLSNVSLSVSNGGTGAVTAAAALSNLGGVPTTRSVTAGTGLTGGGTLAADRTFAVSYGTAAGTAAQGNDSRIVNAVPNTRTVTAGTGLTGGGALSSNITLTVSYGTAAGTAAQGNDSRIVNAVSNGTSIVAGNGLTGGGTLDRKSVV